MIVFSDLHLREESEAVVFDEVLPGILEAALKDDREVAFLGDWWHIRYNVPVNLVNRVRDTFLSWLRQDVRVYIIPGNHDQINFEGRNALEIYSDLPNVSVYTNPSVNKWGVWMPYRKGNAEILESIATVLATNHAPLKVPPILWIHHGVRGSMMNDFRQNDDGLRHEDFSKFHHVFCGHYHKRQSLGTVTYIGSPWQTKADEAGQDKGYGIWNGKEMKFVNTQWGKRFHKIELLPGQKMDLTNVRPNDEVRVVTAEGVDAEAVGKTLAKAGLAHIITPHVAVAEARLQVDPNADLRQYAQAYATLKGDGMDIGRLMKVFDEVTA